MFQFIRLYGKLQKGILSEIDQDVEAQMYEMIIEFFNENGYCHYEISNFARIDENFQKNRNINKNYNLEKRIDFQNFSEIKKNEETLKNEIFKNIETFEMIKERQKNGGRHNLKYWRNKKFIGAGMSAAAYYDKNRHSNIRTFNRYYKFLDNKELPIDENTIEIVDKIESEKLSRMLGLRLIQEGIGYFEDERVEKLIKNGLLEKFIVKKVDFSEKREQKIEKFIDTKEKEIKNKVKNNESFDEKMAEKTYEIRLRLTKRGMLLANDVFVEFI